MTDHPQPLGGNEMPRFAGPGTFMRLPGTTRPENLDVAIVGIPFDLGTSLRALAKVVHRGVAHLADHETRPQTGYAGKCR